MSTSNPTEGSAAFKASKVSVAIFTLVYGFGLVLEPFDVNQSETR
jgi:hypothetical protein